MKQLIALLILMSMPLIFVITKNTFALSTQESTLMIMTPTENKILTRTQLLNQNSLKHITMMHSRAYPGVKLNFTAIKLCDILKNFNIQQNDMIELISSDDFYALVPAKFIMSCSKSSSIAYLAIETEKYPWPRLRYNNPDQFNPETASAGPFQVIWLHPEKSYISNEYWAWKLIKIKIHPKWDAKDYLAPPTTNNPRILNGYQAYMSRCAGCHTINNVGKGKLGPDLNVPISSVKRFDNDEILKKFIRDPQLVRHKKNDRMSGTNEKFLSKQDLDDLILYLYYMADHK